VRNQRGRHSRLIQHVVLAHWIVAFHPQLLPSHHRHPPLLEVEFGLSSASCNLSRAHRLNQGDLCNGRPLWILFKPTFVFCDSPRPLPASTQGHVAVIFSDSFHLCPGLLFIETHVHESLCGMVSAPPLYRGTVHVPVHPTGPMGSQSSLFRVESFLFQGQRSLLSPWPRVFLTDCYLDQVLVRWYNTTNTFRARYVLHLRSCPLWYRVNLAVFGKPPQPYSSTILSPAPL